MEYLQYIHQNTLLLDKLTAGFKPCYKWNTFNTYSFEYENEFYTLSFKPCYKWNTFNTQLEEIHAKGYDLGFKPCYKWNTFNTTSRSSK